MHMTRQDLPATKSGTDLLAMLTKATQEGKAAAADLCSTRLDKLATATICSVMPCRKPVTIWPLLCMSEIWPT